MRRNIDSVQVAVSPKRYLLNSLASAFLMPVRVINSTTFMPQITIKSLSSLRPNHELRGRNLSARRFVKCNPPDDIAQLYLHRQNRTRRFEIESPRVNIERIRRNHKLGANKTSQSRLSVILVQAFRKSYRVRDLFPPFPSSTAMKQLPGPKRSPRYVHRRTQASDNVETSGVPERVSIAAPRTTVSSSKWSNVSAKQRFNCLENRAAVRVAGPISSRRSRRGGLRAWKERASGVQSTFNVVQSLTTPIAAEPEEGADDWEASQEAGGREEEVRGERTTFASARRAMSLKRISNRS